MAHADARRRMIITPLRQRKVAAYAGDLPQYLHQFHTVCVCVSKPRRKPYDRRSISLTTISEHHALKKIFKFDDFAVFFIQLKNIKL